MSLSMHWLDGPRRTCLAASPFTTWRNVRGFLSVIFVPVLSNIMDAPPVHFYATCVCVKHRAFCVKPARRSNKSPSIPDTAKPPHYIMPSARTMALLRHNTVLNLRREVKHAIAICFMSGLPFRVIRVDDMDRRGGVGIRFGRWNLAGQGDDDGFLFFSPAHHLIGPFHVAGQFAGGQAAGG